MAKHTKDYIVSNDESGKPHDPTVIAAILGRIAQFKGKKCKVRVGPADRTLLQNSTIHMIFQEITDQMADCGVVCPKDIVNEATGEIILAKGEPYPFRTWRKYFLDKHCPTAEIPVPMADGAEAICERMSTADLNTVEFKTLIDKILHDPVLISRGILIQIKSEK